MVYHEDRERIKGLLAETITLLCKNGLNYNSEFCIEALIGITLDKDDVFLVSIKETVRSLEKELLRGLPECYSDEGAAVALDEGEQESKEDLSQLKERLSKGGSPQSSPHHSRRRNRRSPKQCRSLGSASPGNAESSSLPNLSLQDMDNDGGYIWPSLTPHNQTTVRGLKQDGDSTKEHLLHSSTNTTSVVSHTRKPFSYEADAVRNFVVIKDEPQSEEDGLPAESCFRANDSTLPAGDTGSDEVKLPSIARLGVGVDVGGGGLSVSAPTHTGARLWQGSSLQGPSPAVMEGTLSNSSFHHQLQQHPPSGLRFHPNEALLPSWGELVNGAESGESVTCNECGRSFMKTEHLLFHHKHDHGQGDYQCTVCGKRFTLRHNMKQHMAKHDMSPQYTCPRCGIKIRYKPNVIRHLKRCTGNQQNLQQSMHTSAMESPITGPPQH